MIVATSNMPWWQRLALLAALLAAVLTTAEGSKIIGFPNPNGKSHILNFIEMLQGMEARGHETGLVSVPSQRPFVDKHSREGLKLGVLDMPDIYADGEIEDIVARLEEKSVWETIVFTFRLMLRIDLCPPEDLRDAASRLKGLKPDLMVVDGTHMCGFILADMLGIPKAVVYTIQPLLHGMQGTHGIFASSAQWPTVQSGLEPYQPTFAARANSMALHQFIYLVTFGLTGQSRMFSRAGLPGRTLTDSGLASRLAIIASDPFLDLPVHLPTYVHQVGAITPAEGGILPQDMEAFLIDSKGHSVYVSFGTTGTGSKTAELFQHVYASLPRVKVLWKVGHTDKPPFAIACRLPNVMCVEWVDQNAVLAHPSLGAFVSHGGHNSISEAAFHGVPTISIAMFGDQFDSSARLVRHGTGLMLNKGTVTSEQIQETIHEILQEPGFKEAAEKLSASLKLFRTRGTPVERICNLLDDELTALEAGIVTWPKALPQLPWWQIHQVDTMLAVAAAVVLSGWLGWKVLTFLGRCCCGRRQKQTAHSVAADKKSS